MPRSVEDILDHAEELAKRFEGYEPAPGDEAAVAEHLLRRAAVDRARSERQITEAVGRARRDGLAWRQIGEALGITAQAAQQKYAARLAGRGGER